MIYHANINQKKSGIAILVSDKVDFKAKKITRDRVIVSCLKMSIHQDNNTKFEYTK